MSDQTSKTATRLRKLAQAVEDAKVDGVVVVFVGDEGGNFAMLPDPLSGVSSAMIGDLKITLDQIAAVVGNVRLEQEQKQSRVVPVTGSLI